MSEQKTEVQTIETPNNLTPMVMLDRAVQSGASVETMERLMALQERWEANQARKAFDNAIAEAKAELPVVLKGKTVDFSTSKGRTHYQYEDLASIAKQVDPILSKHGLSYRFHTATDPNQPVVVSCILSHRDGHSERTALSSPPDTTGNKNSIQAIGSTVTYLQRYTLKAALGLAASSDPDGRNGDNNDPKPFDETNAKKQCVGELKKHGYGMNEALAFIEDWKKDNKDAGRDEWIALYGEIKGGMHDPVDRAGAK